LLPSNFFYFVDNILIKKSRSIKRKSNKKIIKLINFLLKNNIDKITILIQKNT